MRLLLAEDEQSLSKALVAILEGNHYSVDAVYDGVDALAYLDAGNYDALILDIMMPKIGRPECPTEAPRQRESNSCPDADRKIRGG